MSIESFWRTISDAVFKISGGRAVDTSNLPTYDEGSPIAPSYDKDSGATLVHMIANSAPGGSAGTEYTQDAALPTNPVGRVLQLQRDDALSTVTPAEGDAVTAKGNSRGAMWVANDPDADPHAVQQADLELDLDEVTTGGEVDDASPSTVAEGQRGADRITPYRAKHVNLRDQDGNEVVPVTESNFDTKIGSLTEAAPASDTASSGLNGRLQRIAQRITSLIALLPSALTGSGNFKVSVQEALPTGDNNIGNVDVASQPARAKTTDTVTAALDTATIQNGTTSLTPKFAAISASSSGDNTIVAAVVSKKIRVLAAFISASDAVNAKWQSATGGDITGLAYLSASGVGYVLPFNPLGWFETASNEDLQLNLSSAIAVGGSILYCEV